MVCECGPGRHVGVLPLFAASPVPRTLDLESVSHRARELASGVSADGSHQASDTLEFSLALGTLVKVADRFQEVIARCSRTAMSLCCEQGVGLAVCAMSPCVVVRFVTAVRRSITRCVLARLHCRSMHFCAIHSHALRMHQVLVSRRDVQVLQKLATTLINEHHARASRRSSLTSQFEVELLSRFSKFPKICDEDTQAFVRSVVASVRDDWTARLLPACEVCDGCTVCVCE